MLSFIRAWLANKLICPICGEFTPSYMWDKNGMCILCAELPCRCNTCTYYKVKLWCTRSRTSISYDEGCGMRPGREFGCARYKRR